ncbi:hypothetical protein MKL09_31690 [Methylobacterium sp. J-048]|uniref:hypothetical protein n=1 Tax=unclassified Methylobacterium TaxID=2615210 RepID=UPI001FB8864C|nr:MULTISPECIES: hypothetical protein [unclassified Methylobacterium]MCJ2061068.1 hypothetical protein [Methylobacterium sp. J-048]MCJ2094928.1 hypothetical protein [Methylobacterium sp. J-072]
MSDRPAETVSDGLRVAVHMIKGDAYNRLAEAVRFPKPDAAAEDKLRALLTAFYAAYPHVLQELAGR